MLVEEEGELIAVAPLAVREDGMLELVGARDLFEPADFVYRDAAALAALSRNVAGGRA